MNHQKILITGASGFFGSHMVQEVLENTDMEIIALCRMSYIGDIARLLDIPNIDKYKNRLTIIYHDLKFTIPDHMNSKIGKIDFIIHLAANSHVDRSILHPKQFFEDNVIGTVNLFDWYRQYNPQAKCINYLTDEVFGPTPPDYDMKEDDRWRPSNPYSASKCGQGAAGIAYHVTYGLPIITTYTMNMFGERQHKEKLVPKTIHAISKNTIMPIHAKLDENNNVVYVGERHWLHARNVSNATLFLMQHGIGGEHYNIAGNTKFYNDDMVKAIARMMNKSVQIEYTDFHKARPGHDRRYGLDATKLKNMGWKQPISFEEGMEKTISWTLKNNDQ